MTVGDKRVERREGGSPNLHCEPRKVALLVMDFQEMPWRNVGNPALAGRVNGVIALARTVGARVIFVRVAFRNGYPEVAESNCMFDHVRSSGWFREGTRDVVFSAALAPADGDLVLTKRRVSAFHSTELDMILRAAGIQAIIVTGITTSGVVLSTVRAAADLDYRIFVVRDCCADPDEEVHGLMMDKVFPRQAAVLNAGEISRLLNSRGID